MNNMNTIEDFKLIPCLVLTSPEHINSAKSMGIDMSDYIPFSVEEFNYFVKPVKNPTNASYYPILSFDTLRNQWRITWLINGGDMNDECGLFPKSFYASDINTVIFKTLKWCKNMGLINI